MGLVDTRGNCSDSGLKMHLDLINTIKREKVDRGNGELNGKNDMRSFEFNIYSYLVFFFFIFFIGIVFVSFFRFSFSFISTTIGRELFITFLIFLSFLIRNKLLFGGFRPILALLQLIPIVPMYFYLKGKMLDLTPVSSSPERLFFLSFSLSLFIFLFILALSTTSLVYKPLFLTITSLTETGGFIPPISIPQNYAIYIIIHNLEFLFFILVGSIFLFLPTFAENYVSSLIIMPPLGGAALTGNLGYILPNGLLEISGIIIGSATGFVLMASVYEMIKRGKNFSSSAFGSSNYLSVIVTGSIISVLLFIFAWPLEFTLIASTQTGNALPTLWFRFAYTIDGFIIIASVLVMGKTVVGKFVTPLEFFNLFFFMGLFVFVFTITSFGLSNYILFAGILLSISLFFLFRSITSLFEDKQTFYQDFSQHLPDFLQGSISFFYSRGKSMSPYINPADIVIVKQGIDEIKVGDIISYQAKGIEFPVNPAGIVTHRVVSTSGEFIKTKGDNMKRGDPVIHRKQVIGKVIARFSVARSGTGLFEVIDDTYGEQMKQFQNVIFRTSVTTSPKVTSLKNLGITNAVSAAFAVGLFMLILFA